MSHHAAPILLKLLCLLTLACCCQVSMTHGSSEGSDDPKRSKNWPHFRGPGGNGQAIGANPPLMWNVDEGTNIKWKTEVPKYGASSPVVWGNRLFLTGADELSRNVYGFDIDSGQLIWEHVANDITGSPAQDELPRVMKETGYAAPSPTTNGRFVAALFGTGDLVCLTPEGDRVWAKNLGVPVNHYGHASSLISDADHVFVQYDQKEQSSLMAFDFATGHQVWKVERSAISWSSPLLVSNKTRNELIVANSKAVDGYDPETGKLLWHVAGLDGEMASSPAYSDGTVCVAIEYGSAWAIDLSAHPSEPKILWGWDDVLPDASSLLATEDYLIIPSGFGAVNCLDIKTGKVLWEHDFDVGFSSSPIRVNDRVYMADYSGNMQIFKLSARFEWLGTADLGEDMLATPAFVEGRIYMRGLKHLFCVE